MSKVDQLLKRVDFYEKVASKAPEVNSLLNKAAVFERLALYSDRKSFLTAIAQLDQNAANRQLINQALQIMNQAGVEDSFTAPLGNAVLFNKVDIPAIQRAIQTVTLTKLSPLTQQQQINQLKNISSQLKEPLTPEQEDDAAGGEHITFQGDPKKDRITAVPPINPKDQEAVYKFVTINGLGIPGKTTGKLDKDTRTALEAIKNYFAKVNPQNPRMTDQQAIQAAKFEGR